MLATMLRLAVLFVFFATSVAAPLAAQRTLHDLEKQFIKESRRLDREASNEQRDQLLAQQIGLLQTFLVDEAKGDDRWNGRLMLADFQLATGNRVAATKSLCSIETAAAPALLLVTAATMAQHLNLKDQRAAWIAAAVKKQSPVTDRLAMARMLMTVLREVQLGEDLFKQTLAAATDDDQRSFIRWHLADALRDREDLPDNAGFEELEKLAKELPQTYWGSVAADRLRATRLLVGDDAIELQGKTRSGEAFVLKEQQGKAVMLVFWSLADRDLPTLLALVKELRTRHGAKLAVLGICLDRDLDAIAAAVAELGIDIPVIADGKGIECDPALRWFVEGPRVNVIDHNGKVAGLGLHAGTADARRELQDVVAGAIKPQ